MVVRFQTPVQSLLDSVFGSNGSVIDDILSDRVWQGETVSPRLDVAEYENETVVIAELPGVNKSDISLTIHEGVLTISGSRKERTLPEKSSWIRREVGTGKFNRSITLPHEVHLGAVSAEMENGLLKIVLPKAEDAKPKEIKIR